jgi:N-glycosylase/DNA lyase
MKITSRHVGIFCLILLLSIGFGFAFDAIGTAVEKHSYPRPASLADAVAKVISGEISEEVVKSLPYAEAQKYLMQIKGVGPKVADCILLFSCRQYESFPKDVWIKKAMEQLFPNGFPACCKGYEGIAQQYIFHYARHTL